MSRSTSGCPCDTGLAYKACCKPLHDGAPASSPVALMRSRWSAFALGLGVYLVDTLSEGHPERTPAARAAAIRELSRIRERQRFLRLVILDEGVPSTAESTEGEVLFHARIFEKGQDRSFAELSRFVREARHWRYDSGILLPTERLPDDPATLDRERFLELSRRISAAGGGG